MTTLTATMLEETPVKPDKSQLEELLRIFKAADPENELVIFLRRDAKGKPFYIQVEPSSRNKPKQIKQRRQSKKSLRQPRWPNLMLR